jgi:hypothetical protein
MTDMDPRTTPHTDLLKVMFNDPVKFADFYRSTQEVLREDLAREFDDAVTFSIIFLEMSKSDKQKWVNKMRDKFIEVMGKVDASLLDRYKAYVAWEHYNALLTE